MKKFSDVKTTKRIFEQDETNKEEQSSNLPQNIQIIQTPQIGQIGVETQPQVTQTEVNITQGTQSVDIQQSEENIKEEEKIENGTVINLFSKLFESREMSHIYHLQVRGDDGSHAKHMALNVYYTSIIEYIDELIETYQGQYGIIDGYDIIDTKETKTKDPIAYFEELTSYIKHARKCISEEDTHLHNIIDEIIALMYKTLYKLKFNK